MSPIREHGPNVASAAMVMESGFVPSLGVGERACRPCWRLRMPSIRPRMTMLLSPHVSLISPPATSRLNVVKTVCVCHVHKWAMDKKRAVLSKRVSCEHMGAAKHLK